MLHYIKTALIPGHFVNPANTPNLIFRCKALDSEPAKSFPGFFLKGTHSTIHMALRH